MSDFDPQLAELGRALLEHASAFDVALSSLLEKLKATHAILEQAKKQPAKSHVINATDAAAGMQTVVATSTATEARTLTQAEALALLQQQQRQQQKARATLQELAGVFHRVADQLEEGATHADEISVLLHNLSR